MAINGPKRAGQETDFNASELLAAHEVLTERMARVEGHLQTPQALAKFFQDSTNDSRVLDGVFAEMFCRFMDENPKVKEAVKKKMEEIDRAFFFKACKRIWLPVYSIALIVGTVFIEEVMKWVISLIPHH